MAADIIDGLEHDRSEIRIDRVNALAMLARLWPGAADRIIARELSRTAAGLGA